MSLLKLGGISTTLKSNELPNFYLASVIHSQSGFTYPKMIYKVSDLDSFYGDFTYIDMYRDILNKNIPVLFIPTITEESDYNKCSLRISTDERFRVSHPAINYDYEPQVPEGEIADPDQDINSFTYGVLLDFTDVDKITDGNYVILNGTCKDDLGEDQLVINNSNFIIWFKLTSDSLSPVSRTDAKASLTIRCYNDSSLDPKMHPSRDCVNSDTGKITDKDSLMWLIKYQLNNRTLCTAYDIDDLLLHKLNDSDEDDVQPNGVLTTYFENTPIEFSEADYNTDYNTATFGSYEKYLEYHSNEYISELEKFMMCREYNVVNRSTIIREVKRILKDKIFTIDHSTFDNIYDLFSQEWVNSSLRSEILYRIFVEYISEPGKKVDIFNLDNFNITDLDHVTQDRFSSFTQSTRLLEFYSKVKGPVGKNVKVTIKKASDDFKYYDITISMGTYQEFYQVDLEYDPNEYSYSEYKSIYQLDNSELVDFIYYDFIVDSQSSTIRVQSKDADEYLDPSEVEEKWIEWKRGDYIVDLPEGEFYLDRSIEETWDYEDEINSFKLIESYEYYPDLILVDILPLYDLPEAKLILNSIRDITDNVFSQALIQLTPDFIYNYDADGNAYERSQESVKADLVNIKSRLLYFYGSLRMNNIPYTTYYPYILNIINSDYIKRVSESIIYRVSDEIVELLDKVGINYLLYNNLYYNYNRIKESGYDPDFIIRFNTSKITRVFMNNKEKLLNCEDKEFDGRISSLVDICTNVLPLVNYLSYSIESDNANLRNIELIVQIKSVTNKKFVLNINLNL